MIIIKKKIQLTIQEIVNDYYCLAETEGYLSGLAEVGCCEEKDKQEYHYNMKNMIDKYLPNWKDNIEKEYWESNDEDEKGVILSTVLCENFKEIFYQLV